ncbi:hypothetical protein VTN77DRAFT_9115 [Rasamsonia byssochlamydoides]|uniref:uncharacterized protein n=1 Tax=Rasamsonia byssochlamydoides TaxID=89139 RepID=UPI003744482A
MSPPRLPPTPSMSGELIIKDQQNADMSESSFALPPAALSPTSGEIKGAARKDSTVSVSYCPVSPTSPDLAAMGRTASNPPRHAGTKRALDEFNLPPPPTRTRKIIQMKPKTQQSPPKPAASSTSKPKETGKGQANTPAQPNSKKKQPSATSAAGRKIARKTAHSLIERRRRSKMNEEFATLKNMIPACKGQEMHKLAILQASIDYVNYLEQCIRDLKAASGRSNTTVPPGPPSPTSPEVAAGAEESGISMVTSSSTSPELLPSGAQSAQYSPAFSPRNPGLPQRQPSLEFSTTILPSPALRPTQSPPHLNWRPSTQPVSASASTSPAILPQQRNSISSYSVDTDIDHEASAALLMLNRDRRGTMDSLKSVSMSAPAAEAHPTASSDRSSEVVQDKQKKMGMSVRDLLVS